ncbi:pyrroline-5-carboxylate reductase dimerization domain-containing protein [Streptomyces sp. Edi2]|uniref:pyrroline-5-carboxylate reductase family protein n=1 Tax=Streptomyces sp. Edi2 TaxID=3162528 RepID=UPI00330600FB
MRSVRPDLRRNRAGAATAARDLRGGRSDRGDELRARTTIAFIGCGRISRAVVSGLVTAGWSPERLRGVSRTGAGARALAAEFGLVAMPSAPEAVRGADIVILAVHPHEMRQVLGGLVQVVSADQLLVSLVASWHTDAVAAALPGVPVIRAVPNVAVALCAGVTALSVGSGADREHLELARGVFGSLGRVLGVDEAQMETVSSLSGAGPALVARFAQALAEAAAVQGLGREVADQLAAHAVKSTGALLTGGGLTPDAVVDSVASPGGMTEAALDILEKRELTGAVGAALEAAVDLSLSRLATGEPPLDQHAGSALPRCGPSK